VYVAQLHLSGLPAVAVHYIRESIFGGVAVAQRLHSPVLLHSVRAAFVQGTDQALIVSAAVALAGALLAILFLPAARLENKESRQEAASKHDLVIGT
jgi:MFS transporter, DHA2 family, multidrug resistance protein